jgi:hypothetical protein
MDHYRWPVNAETQPLISDEYSSVGNRRRTAGRLMPPAGAVSRESVDGAANCDTTLVDRRAPSSTSPLPLCFCGSAPCAVLVTATLGLFVWSMSATPSIDSLAVGMGVLFVLSAAVLTVLIGYRRRCYIFFVAWQCRQDYKRTRVAARALNNPTEDQLALVIYHTLTARALCAWYANAPARGCSYGRRLTTCALSEFIRPSLSSRVFG